MKKIILLLLFAAAFASCKKNGSDCENWVVMDYCIPKQSSVSCADPNTHTIPVCGNDLSDARAGREKVRMENSEAKLMRKYIQKAP